MVLVRSNDLSPRLLERLGLCRANLTDFNQDDFVPACSELEEGWRAGFGFDLSSRGSFQHLVSPWVFSGLVFAAFNAQSQCIFSHHVATIPHQIAIARHQLAHLFCDFLVAAGEDSNIRTAVPHEVRCVFAVESLQADGVFHGPRPNLLIRQLKQQNAVVVLLHQEAEGVVLRLKLRILMIEHKLVAP